MILEVASMQAKLQSEGYSDIIVTHAPPYGILDEVYKGKRIGNQRLTNSLNYNFKRLPRMILCGHIHENTGVEIVEFGDFDFGREPTKVIVSNAATTQNYLEIKS
jgi:Icc-related predicted phosphoesterase